MVEAMVGRNDEMGCLTCGWEFCKDVLSGREGECCRCQGLDEDEYCHECLSLYLQSNIIRDDDEE